MPRLVVRADVLLPCVGAATFVAAGQRMACLLCLARLCVVRRLFVSFAPVCLLWRLLASHVHRSHRCPSRTEQGRPRSTRRSNFPPTTAHLKAEHCIQWHRGCLVPRLGTQRTSTWMGTPTQLANACQHSTRYCVQYTVGRWTGTTNSLAGKATMARDSSVGLLGASHPMRRRR